MASRYMQPPAPSTPGPSGQTPDQPRSVLDPGCRKAADQIAQVPPPCQELAQPGHGEWPRGYRRAVGNRGESGRAWIGFSRPRIQAYRHIEGASRRRTNGILGEPAKCPLQSPMRFAVPPHSDGNLMHVRSGRGGWVPVLSASSVLGHDLGPLTSWWYSSGRKCGRLPASSTLCCRHRSGNPIRARVTRCVMARALGSVAPTVISTVRTPPLGTRLPPFVQ
jgi:hypothetical protein